MIKMVILKKIFQALLGPTVALTLGHIFMSQNANAFEVQTLTSPKGIDYWLVESSTLPLVTMKFSLKQGSVRDEAGKEGTAYLLSGLLDDCLLYTSPSPRDA